jgi:hypothetical protein
MASVKIGWETISISNPGAAPPAGMIARALGPAGGEGQVHSVQIGLRLGNSAMNPPNQAGRPVVLVDGWFSPDANFSGGPGPANTDWGTYVDINPNHYQIGPPPGSSPQGWGVDASPAGLVVFGITMECQLPGSDNWRSQIFLPPDTIIPGGSYFVIRVIALTIPANIKLDFETSGTIFYG